SRMESAAAYADALRAVPAIWVGGSGEKLTLNLAARLADGVNLQGKESVIAHKLSLLREICREQDRLFDSLTISKQANVIIDTTQEKIAQKLARIMPDESKWKSFRENNVVGTPEECLSSIARFLQLGVSYFTLNFPDLFDLESIRLFDHEVIGRIQSEVYA
ncbi:MAG: LLM class flavin-dependent oxidoreductase, partial [Nitrososphaerales archaeon]